MAECASHAKSSVGIASDAQVRGSHSYKDGGIPMVYRAYIHIFNPLKHLSIRFNLFTYQFIYQSIT
jgi:hypothetical protein